MKKVIAVLLISTFVLAGCSTATPEPFVESNVSSEVVSSIVEASVEESSVSSEESSVEETVIKAFNIDSDTFLTEINAILQARGFSSVLDKKVKIKEEEGKIKSSYFIDTGCFMYISTTSDKIITSVDFAQFMNTMTDSGDKESTAYVTASFSVLAPNSDFIEMLEQLDKTGSPTVTKNDEIALATSYSESASVFSTFLLPVSEITSVGTVSASGEISENLQEVASFTIEEFIEKMNQAQTGKPLIMDEDNTIYTSNGTMYLNLTDEDNKDLRSIILNSGTDTKSAFALLNTTLYTLNPETPKDDINNWFRSLLEESASAEKDEKGWHVSSSTFNGVKYTLSLHDDMGFSFYISLD